MSNQAVQPESHEFQAEVRQLLDIVVHSLYTDREVFIRELISNAVDASEKVRHLQVINAEMAEPEKPLEIRIKTDKDAKTFEIADHGVGMTREELSENLGTIAHSGTKAFLNKLREQGGEKDDLSLIGQFGVGFYSVFMVGQKVTVETRSYHTDSQGWVWTSDGSGSYSVEPREGLSRGTRIVVDLKEDAEKFADEDQVKEFIQRFSNFVPIPIFLNGERVNTIEAIWSRNKSEISEEEYKEFYKFVANAHDEPRYTLHFSADAPLAIHSVLFVPQDNFEHMGLGRTEPGVDLYCRKVLIQKRPEKFLPEWMRFVRGVIDSEDLPLNISRESMQDSALIRKVARVITGRFIKFLEEKATWEEDAEGYKEFYDRFGMFIKEGILQDFQHQDQLANLLRFETSKTEPGKSISLEEYVNRMQDGQSEVYFLNGPNRETIESGPYLEAFKERDLEVIYTFDAMDDYVLERLGKFNEKPIKSAESADLDLPEKEEEGDKLSKEETESLCGWLKTSLGERVSSVRASKRLSDSPALVASETGMTSSMRRMMAAVQKDPKLATMGLTLEINPAHSLIKRIQGLRSKDEELAKEVAHQLLDNSLLSAGLLSNPQEMVTRLNKLLERAAGTE